MAHKLVIYPVILHPEETGYSVEIPDINNGAWTQGESMEEALEMATDLIGTMLVDEMTWPNQPLSKIFKLQELISKPLFL